jgi:hypothetical protein
MTASNLPSCMGGFKCPVRGSCRNYLDTLRPGSPEERLCRHDGHDAYMPIIASDLHAQEHHQLALIHSGYAA